MEIHFEEMVLWEITLATAYLLGFSGFETGTVAMGFRKDDVSLSPASGDSVSDAGYRHFTILGGPLHKTLSLIRNSTNCGSVGVLGIAWSFEGMIFILVYCTAGISGGHINLAVTFGLFLARKVSLPRANLYMIAQFLGAICGNGLVKAFQKSFYDIYGGGANYVHHGYTKGVGLAAEIIGTFVLVYTVFSATDPKRSARDSHVPVLAPLPIGFVVFMVHLATIPITGIGINPARSFGAAVIYGHKQSWNDHWIFWVGPFSGAALAAAYHQYILRAAAIKALGSFRSNANV